MENTTPPAAEAQQGIAHAVLVEMFWGSELHRSTRLNPGQNFVAGADGFALPEGLAERHTLVTWHGTVPRLHRFRATAGEVESPVKIGPEPLLASVPAGTAPADAPCGIHFRVQACSADTLVDAESPLTDELLNAIFITFLAHILLLAGAYFGSKQSPTEARAADDQHVALMQAYLAAADARETETAKSDAAPEDVGRFVGSLRLEDLPEPGLARRGIALRKKDKALLANSRHMTAGQERDARSRYWNWTPEPAWGAPGVIRADRIELDRSQLRVTSGLPETLVARILDQSRGRIDKCTRGSPYAGMVVMRFTIAETGQVAQVSDATKSRVSHDDLTSCLAKVLLAVKFPAPERSVNVQYPVLLPD
jgi:hypothetical protein